MPHAPSIRPDPYRPPSREQIERARDMYIQKFTVSRILAACDMSLGTFYYWLDGGPHDEESGRRLPPISRRRVVVGKRRKPLSASHVSLVARLYRTAERQVFDIEQRLAVPAGATPERERDVRMLAMLTRTLRDLSAFGAAEVTGAGGAATQDDGLPPDLDIEALRASLARKLDALVAEQQTGVPAEEIYRGAIGKS